MKISILTPTYNRAKLLDKLYTSILINSNTSNCEIEWLIMDDGSTDNTKKVVEQYVKEKIIEVKYFYQENSGKMAALNKIVEEAQGDVIIECDSDDFFIADAFKQIEDAIKKCENVDNVYAILFLKYDQNGKNMGNNFLENKFKSTMFDLYFKQGIIGEKVLVFNSKIRKQYKYELEQNERFVTEARLYHKMDLKYNVICFNKAIMICEYKEDGYSKNIYKLFKENPNGYFQYFKEILEHDLSGTKLQKKLYIYKHYILFSILSKQKDIIKQVNGNWNKIMIIILYLPGKIATKRKFNI